MPALIPMDFDGNEIAYFLDDALQPWWPANGPCRVLGYDMANVSHVMDRLHEDEKGRYPVTTLGGLQTVWCINEAGMYRLIFGSDKLEAEHFRRWIFHDVLPEIRKHGRYSIADRDKIGFFSLPSISPMGETI